MVIYGIYIVSKSGGLIFNYDNNVPKIETEKKFSYPLDIKLQIENKKIIVEFGQRDGIHVGHVLYAVNGVPVTGRQMDDGQDALEFLDKKENYPVTLKFGPSQLSPEPKTSGIEVLEADTFRLNCFQTLTGVKIMIVSDPHQTGVEILLKRIYEIYADFALKNPFYSLEMPIRCELFDSNLKNILEQIEKSGIANI
ncbi:hypothetical protein NQ314_016092 [Rhamnusium bicolor]|uniref:Trafficking protein particle complex subunit n=1 Tax=Rhamnusium bicolor TaxID=1586634 RepID=A0AAV8WX44_9CUCU|nr:hypothetical protein NQ314_016092 [Rhamnusium bicolor]